MYKEEIFRLIREEDTLLWVGAGFSQALGYPSGMSLSKQIYDSLSKSEKNQIDSNGSLAKIADDFIKIKGGKRQPLVKLLKDIFSDKQNKPKYHSIIATIPHFKHIITTNYDRLFEQAYGSNIQTVVTAQEIPYLDNDKVHLFKVHGDLSKPESIIVSESDYLRFFSKDVDSVYWNVILEKITTKNILFIGYNLEDPNINYLFEKVSSQLLSDMKQVFFVAPKLPDYRKNDLVRKGIQYIDDTGENFIDELLINIKENIVSDFRSKRVTVDTFNKFMLLHDLELDLSFSNNSNSIQSVRSKDQSTKGILKFEIADDPLVAQSFDDFIKGKTFGSFELSVNNMQYSIAGINLSDKNNKSAKIVISNRAKEWIVDISYPSFELSDIHAKLYASHLATELVVEYKTIKMSFKGPANPNEQSLFNFSFEHTKNFGKVFEEINVYNLLKHIVSGEYAFIHLKNGDTLRFGFSRINEVYQLAEEQIEFFEALKKIESHFNVRFDIKSITAETFKTVRNIMAVVNNEPLEGEWVGELTLTYIDDDDLPKIKALEAASKPIVIQHDTPELCELFNTKLNIGYQRMEFKEPCIVRTDLQNKKLYIMGRNKKVTISYLKEFPSTNDGAFVINATESDIREMD